MNLLMLFNNKRLVLTLKTKGKRAVRKRSIIISVSIAVVLCFFFISFFRMKGRLNDLEEHASDLAVKATELSEEVSQLNQLLLDGDVDKYVEDRARDEDLGYVMPGERVYYDLEVAE